MNERPFIVLAPFANERMREWPLDEFRRFTELALHDGLSVMICGTQAQRPLANEVVRMFPADRVHNKCGRVSWTEMEKLLQQARFVVANNSGVAHFSAKIGTWTLCIFGAKHSWIEWFPRGPKVVTLVRGPACSPCESGVCSNRFVCLRDIDAEMAYLEMKYAMSSEAAS